MKQVCGFWLPDGDTHFSAHLEKEQAAFGVPGYQTKKRRAALPHIKRFRRAVDIGAHVGLWAVPLAVQFDHVTAFEPSPSLLECLQENASDFSNIETIGVALSHEHGMLRISDVVGNSGNAHVARGDEVGNSVEMCALDDYGLRGVDFIKIDCEGYEVFVVRGAEQTIRRSRPTMVVEQKPGNGSAYGVSDTAAIDLLTKWGASVAWQKSGDYCLVWR